MQLTRLTSTDLDRIASQLDAGLDRAASVEDAASTFCHTLYDEFPAVLLARVFLTMPYASLDTAGKRFVDARVAPASRPEGLTALTLLGTAGKEPAWNDRKRSGGHVAIPLLSSEFVNGIPMLARLLSDMHFDIEGLDDRDGILTRVGGFASLFYVDDARTAVDQLDRPIIAARDFVDTYDVRTVFGVGGGYMLSDAFVTAIVFTRAHVPREICERFTSLLIRFKAKSQQMLRRGHVYQADRQTR